MYRSFTLILQTVMRTTVAVHQNVDKTLISANGPRVTKKDFHKKKKYDKRGS